METKKENQKRRFDTVKIFRKIKDEVSEDLKGMSFDEIKEYLKKNSAKLGVDSVSTTPNP